MKNKLLLGLFSLCLFIVSCSDSSTGPENPGNEGNNTLASVYVINSGNFGDANGSITAYNPTDHTTTQLLFQEVNGKPMAGYLQSVSAFDGKLFIVSNDANKIEVVDAKTFKSIATIPVNFDPVNVASAGKGQIYVTNLYGNSVSIVDLETNQLLEKTIAVGKNPYDILTTGGYTYVVNNGFGDGTTVSVIDPDTDQVVKTIEVGYGPTDFALEEDGQLWVVCNGRTGYDEDYNRVPEKDEPGSIYVIDTKTAQIVDFIVLDGRPTHMVINDKKDIGYLLSDGVYRIDTEAIAMMDSKLTNRNFKSIGYSAEEKLIYMGLNIGNYTQPGKVVQFNLQGVAVDSFGTGITPIGFYFLNK